MAGPVDLSAMKDGLVVLGAAALVVPAMHRLKVSPVLGFLLAGVALGPSGLGALAVAMPWLDYVTVGDTETIRKIGEFGVVFLLFIIGLEIPLERLLTMRRMVFGLGAAQLLVLAALIAVPLGLAGVSVNAAIVIGFALALSSTALVVDLLAREGRLATGTGRVSLPVLLFEDLAVVPVLFLIAALGAPSGGNVWLGIALAVGQAVLAIAIIVVTGRLVLRPLFRLVAGTDSPELFMAAALFVVVATAVLTGALGLSMALGAFIAGLLLAETEYRKAIESMLEPFKGLLLGVFFLSVGMTLDLRVVIGDAAMTFGGALALIAVKAVGFYLLVRAFRIPRRYAIESAALLAPAGEFAFVIIGLAASLAIVDQALATRVLTVVALTLLALPLLDLAGRRLGQRLAPPKAEPVVEVPTGTETARALVVGHGRVGELVCAMLDRHKVPYLAVERDPAVVAAWRRAGRPVYFGDPTNPVFLRQCGIGQITCLILTTHDHKATGEIIRVARTIRSDLRIVARARDADHASQLYALGATDAVPETIEASLQLSEATLIRVGVPMGLIIASIHEKRDEYRVQLQRASGVESPTHAFRARQVATPPN
jgi:CPA2 family monovalent cation:H+ antiporter-2